MKIYNQCNSNYNNRTTFKGCDISKMGREVVQDHVQYLNPQKDEVTRVTNTIMESIKRIYDKYKSHPEIDIVVEDWKDSFGKPLEKGCIQARWIRKGTTPDLSDKVVLHADGHRDLANRLEHGISDSKYS